jgi:hypothetical protein
VIKTHTPLDGVPIDDRATYIVVGRHPLDLAVSLYHQGDNIDRARLNALTGHAPPARPPRPRPPVAEWLREWIDADVTPQQQLDSLPGVLWHLTDAWSRRGTGNVVLVHYDDLSADLEGEMRRLASRLGIEVPPARWPALIDAATFASMRSHADVLAPDHLGVLKDKQAFFRRGASGAGHALLAEKDLARYRERAAALAPPDLLAWLHRAKSPRPPQAFPRQ